MGVFGMKRAWVSGVNGFVGSHLAEYLLQKSYKVFGFIRFRADMSNLEHIKDKITYFVGDVTDMNSIKNALEKCKPDEIYHLAANSYVPYSWVQPVETFNTNCIGFINLLETVRLLKLQSKIMIAGSSEEYGLVSEDEVPIKEDQPFRPMSPYGVSKIGMDLLAQQYVASYGMNIFIARGFNHTGPRRGEPFVCSNFAKQVAEIKAGKKKFLLNGDISSVRDFTDVRDMVKAYVLALNCDKIVWGEPYNICSGKGYVIGDIIEMLKEIADIEFETKIDPARNRPSDVPLLIGDNSKFVKATGWKRTYDFKTTLSDLYQYWLERI